MAIEVKKITDNGKRRWIRVDCPICSYSIVNFVILGEPREKECSCSECGAKFIITWNESDETLH